MALTANGSDTGFEPRIGRSVSLDHAAQLLGVSRRTIYNRIREGRLQTIRTLGGSQRVLVESMQGSASDGYGDGRDDKGTQIHGRATL
jgi:excisionase family DNA binding protein